MKMMLRPITKSLRTGASVFATPVTSSVIGLEMLLVPSILGPIRKLNNPYAGCTPGASNRKVKLSLACMVVRIMSLRTK